MANFFTRFLKTTFGRPDPLHEEQATTDSSAPAPESVAPHGEMPQAANETAVSPDATSNDTDQDALVQALAALVNADTWQATHDVLVREQALLLTDAADQRQPTSLSCVKPTRPTKHNILSCTVRC